MDANAEVAARRKLLSTLQVELSPFITTRTTARRSSQGIAAAVVAKLAAEGREPAARQVRAEAEELALDLARGVQADMLARRAQALLSLVEQLWFDDSDVDTDELCGLKDQVCVEIAWQRDLILVCRLLRLVGVAPEAIELEKLRENLAPNHKAIGSLLHLLPNLAGAGTRDAEHKLRAAIKFAIQSTAAAAAWAAKREADDLAEAVRLAARDCPTIPAGEPPLTMVCEATQSPKPPVSPPLVLSARNNEDPPFEQSVAEPKLAEPLPTDYAADTAAEAKTGRIADDFASKKRHVPVLTEIQEEVKALIYKEGPVIGKTIAGRLGIGHETLRSHVIPALKEHFGLQNLRNGRGYFFPPMQH